MKRLLIAAIIITSLCLPTACDAAQKPNLIFVLSDDIAQGDLGVYGQKLIKTPNLDRLCREGTRYLSAYTGTSVCAPARSSFSPASTWDTAPREPIGKFSRKGSGRSRPIWSPSGKSSRKLATKPPRWESGAWACFTRQAVP